MPLPYLNPEMAPENQQVKDRFIEMAFIVFFDLAPAYCFRFCFLLLLALHLTLQQHQIVYSFLHMALH